MNANVNGDETVPVWIAPRGSKKVKLAAFVVYLRAMRERAAYHSRDTQLPEVRISAAARADVYALVADQLEKII